MPCKVLIVPTQPGSAPCPSWNYSLAPTLLSCPLASLFLRCWEQPHWEPWCLFPLPGVLAPPLLEDPLLTSLNDTIRCSMSTCMFISLPHIIRLPPRIQAPQRPGLHLHTTLSTVPRAVLVTEQVIYPSFLKEEPHWVPWSEPQSRMNVFRKVFIMGLHEKMAFKPFLSCCWYNLCSQDYTNQEVLPGHQPAALICFWNLPPLSSNHHPTHHCSCCIHLP